MVQRWIQININWVIMYLTSAYSILVLQWLLKTIGLIQKDTEMVPWSQVSKRSWPHPKNEVQIFTISTFMETQRILAFLKV